MYFQNNKKSIKSKLNTPRPCPYHSRIKTNNSAEGRQKLGLPKVLKY